jgi:hypothetical protein
MLIKITQDGIAKKLIYTIEVTNILLVNVLMTKTNRYLTIFFSSLPSPMSKVNNRQKYLTNRKITRLVVSRGE